MSDLPSGFDVGQVHCYPSPDDPTICYCIPGEPTPEVGPDGRPTLGLWMIPSHPRLQLGARWVLSSADIGAAESALATDHTHTTVPGKVNIATAPVEVDTAVVLIADSSSPASQLTSSSPSGFPPFSAIFSAQLDDAQCALAASALNGGRGHLFVEYRARLENSVPLLVSVAGDITEEAAAIAPGASLDQALDQIESALEAGHLTLTQVASESLPDEVWQPFNEQALGLAAQDLQQVAGANPAGSAPSSTNRVSIRHEVRGRHTESTALTRRVDVATWFGDATGAEHIHVLPAEPPNSP